MKISIFFGFFLVLSVVSCKSEFEAIRTSGDATKMYEKANEFYENGNYVQAITLYELVIPAFRGKSEAEQLYFNYADAHFKNSSYTLSAHYFKTFADTYNTSDKREEATFLRALSHYKLSPKFKLDQTQSEKAIEIFQLYANTYPESDRIAQCNQYIDNLREKMVLKAFDTGVLYYNTRNYKSAIQSFQNMLKDYPDSDLVDDARYYIVKSSLNHAEQSIFTRQEERYRQTVDHCNAYMKKHPDGIYAEEINSCKLDCLNQIKKIENG